MSIPDWNVEGVIPPIRPGALGHDGDRSPYDATLDELIDRFTITSARAAILSGFMKYRAELHRIGVNQGFQWLDGSFLEDVESDQGRAPRDMDVVTFFSIPAGHTQTTFLPIIRPLIDSAATKMNYSVDAYVFPLEGSMNAASIRRISYWYSMWSHRRSGLWKGFVQISLDPASDQAGLNLLNMKVAGGLP